MFRAFFKVATIPPLDDVYLNAATAYKILC